MPCYHPLTAYWDKASGAVFFDLKDQGRGETIELPCGRCVGCRLERARQWAMRITHEASMWDQSTFDTLTYAPEHLPPGGSLRYRDVQLFLKRLRKKFLGRRIPFFVCGEYGEKENRPHYHIILFNHAWSDRKLLKEKNGNKVYTSETLSKLWGLGDCVSGSVTFESASYVARYSMGKITGDLAQEHYRSVDLETGEVVQRVPEFAHMSTRPAIGRLWIERFMSDVFPRGLCVARGRECVPPRYYMQQWKRRFSARGDAVQLLEEQRAAAKRARYLDNTPERLADKERVANALVSLKTRSIE